MASSNPLRVVEQRLGIVDTWLFSIIWFLFLERPTTELLDYLRLSFMEITSLLHWRLGCTNTATYISLLL